MRQQCNVVVRCGSQGVEPQACSLLRAPQKCHPCACALAGQQATNEAQSPAVSCSPTCPPWLGNAIGDPSSAALLRTSSIFTFASPPASPAGPSLAGPRRRSWVCSPSCWRVWRTLVRRRRSPAGEQGQPALLWAVHALGWLSRAACSPLGARCPWLPPASKEPCLLPSPQSMPLLACRRGVCLQPQPQSWPEPQPHPA